MPLLLSDTTSLELQIPSVSAQKRSTRVLKAKFAFIATLSGHLEIDNALTSSGKDYFIILPVGVRPS